MRGCERSEVYYWYFGHDTVKSGRIIIIMYEIFYLNINQLDALNSVHQIG